LTLNRVAGQSAWLSLPACQEWLKNSIELFESEDQDWTLAIAICHPLDKPCIVVSQSLLEILNPSERVALLALLVACIQQKRRIFYALFELSFQNLMWLTDHLGMNSIRGIASSLAVRVLHQFAYFLNIDDAATQMLRDLDIERRALATTIWKLQNLEMTQRQKWASPLKTSLIVDLPESGGFIKSHSNVHFRIKRLVGSYYI
jgi:hypothetical protein